MDLFVPSTTANHWYSLEASPGWGIYPLVTLPLTLIVLIAWNEWRKRRKANISSLTDIDSYKEEYNASRPSISIAKSDLRSI